MRSLTIALLCLIPCVAEAETPLSADEFEARVTGKTLTYSSSGMEFGIEEYLDDRRVRWSFLDGECLDGYWYASGSRICFVYDDLPDHQCWQFYSHSGRLLARFENDPTRTELYETHRSPEPLVCLGPKVGA